MLFSIILNKAVLCFLRIPKLKFFILGFKIGSYASYKVDCGEEYLFEVMGSDIRFVAV